MNTNLTNGELQSLINSDSERHWNQICDEIKKKRDGEYPPDWFVKVLLSGVATMAQLGWKK